MTEIVYPVKLPKDLYERIKETIKEYNNTVAKYHKIKSIHHFIRLAIENYLEDLELAIKIVKGESK